MDNTAPGAPVPQDQQDAAGQQPVPVAVQQQQAVPTPASTPTQQHVAVRPMEPPQHPVGVAPRRESGPVATTAPAVDTSVQPVVAQEASVVQQAHPEVSAVIPQEVKDAGVEPGRDANTQHLPEVKQTVTEAGDIQQPVISAVQSGDDDIKLDMSLEEAEQAAKKTKSIKSGLAWIMREIIRQWKKKDAKEE